MVQMMTAAAAREKLRSGRGYVITLTVLLVGRKFWIDQRGSGGQMMIPRLLLMLMVMVSTGGGLKEGIHVPEYFLL